MEHFELEVNIQPEVVDKYLTFDDKLVIDEYAFPSILHYIFKWESGQMAKHDFEERIASIIECSKKVWMREHGDKK